MMRRKRENRLLEEMVQYERDLAWVIDNYDELIREYADAYVAVLNGKVVEHASRVEDLVETLRRKHARQLPKILVEFIYSEHPNFVL